MNDKKSFEETYVRYPFPLLVDFGLALSGLFVRTRDRGVQPQERAPKVTTFAR